MMHLWRLLLLVAIAGLFPSISEAAEVPGRVTADTQAPTAPSELTAIAVSSSQIELSWTASTGNTAVTGYRIYRNGAQVTTTTSNSYSDTGLEASTSYSYTVAAYDATPNTSAKSESAAATTFPPGSTKPRIGARVEVTNGPLDVRATPSSAGTLLCSEPVGSMVTVIGGPTNADGYNWWNIKYDYECVVEGWSVEDNLVDFRRNWEEGLARFKADEARKRIEFWAYVKTAPILSPGEEFVPGEVIVGFVDGTTDAEKNAILARYNVTVEKGYDDDVLILKVPENSEVAIATALQPHPKVKFVELNKLIPIDDLELTHEP